MPFIDTNITLAWIYDSTLGGIIRKVLSDTNIKYIKSSVLPVKYNFKQLKNYQFVTGLTGSGQLGTFSIKFENPFKNETTSLRRSVLTSNGVKFYTYNRPNVTLQTDTLIYYGSDDSFTTSAITSTSVNEIDFLINGFREFTYLDKPILNELQPSGWFYEVMPGDSKPSYNVFLSATSSSISPSYSTLGSGLNFLQPLPKNFIAKYIEYDKFNLDFTLYTSLPGVLTNVYLLTLDKLNEDPVTWGTSIVGTFSASNIYNRLGLSGTNFDGTKNYLVFSCDIPQFRPGVNLFTNAPSSPPILVPIHIKISDINIYGTYHPTSNNRLSLTDTTINPIGLSIPNATYSYTLINNGGTFSIPSRIGNGAFRSGIWENGVWNNGWRDDTIAKEFDDVYLSILNTSDVSWKIEIRGAPSAIDGFATGSNVSIGNIVAIDINENRKLLKDYYQIESLGVDMGSPQNGIGPYGFIRFNLDTSFPYRRIEKDSPNHKIKVTKNIWLSGGFFNGYFSGVWNNGLFKGYPLLTEMFNSHWIDGLFDGGRFNSSYSVKYDFNKFGPKVGCSNDFMDLTFLSVNATPFLIGDYIFLTLVPSLIGDLGTNLYSGVCQIVDFKIDNDLTILDNQGITIPNPYYGGQIITINKRSIGKPIYDDVLNPWGSAYRYTASSVIQNFKFYDNNRSKIKSSDSQLSLAVFKFNSWIDVNYDNTRSVTLARDFRAYEPLTGKSVNRNNLYGYPTYDILSSASRFRDSNSLDFKLYKLGTKYKIFTDFIGDNSEFNEPFNDIDFTNFTNAGWTYSYIKSSDYSLKRTETLITLNNAESNALLSSGVTGDELYITASNTGLILNNNNISINKSRYSVVEFDVITYSVVDVNYNHNNYDIFKERSISSSTLPFIETVDPSGYLTASYNLSTTTSVEIDDIVVMIDIYGDVPGTTINLKAPNGRIINVKKLGSGIGNRMEQTGFSLRDVYTKFSLATSPFSLNNNTISYSDTYQMDKENNQGDIPFKSDTKLLSDLLSGGINGTWTLYVKYNSTATIVCDLLDWSIDLKYKTLLAINNEPTSSFPILNFNNLNYDITTQLSGYDNVQTYKKMNYLPISDNVNHLLSQNTFRLDSIELATPARWGGFGKNQKTKKYEYFYNKTDMMLSISGNGATGGSESMVVLDNLNMYEIDMIPFFKYFEESNIYKGIQFPYIGTSPEIDYAISDFVFIDNITIGLDSINPIAVDTTFIGCGNISFTNLTLRADITNITLPYTTTSYQFVNMTSFTNWESSLNGPDGSVTCSTTFDTIQWSINSDPGSPSPTIENTSSSTLYPLVLGLTTGGNYTISINSMTKNSIPSQEIGPISARIFVSNKPLPVTTVSPTILSVNFVPGQSSFTTISYNNLLNGYSNSLGFAAQSIQILTVPSIGTLVYNGAVITSPISITITGTTIQILYYPEGLGIRNSGFINSFNYQVTDIDGNPLTAPFATMNIVATIPASVITVDSPLSKDIEYSVGEPPVSAIKYFSQSELIQNYQNIPTLVPANSIKIISVPLRGQLSYGGNLVGPNYIINVSDLIIGDSFGYWPQGINQLDVIGGSFSTQFTYMVLDGILQQNTQDNQSNLVTFDLNCIEVEIVIPPDPPSPVPYIRYADFSDQSNKVMIPYTEPGTGTRRHINYMEIVNETGAPRYIWIRLENYNQGLLGEDQTVSFDDVNAISTVLSVYAPEPQTVFSELPYLLQNNETLIGNLQQVGGDDTYNATMWWSYNPVADGRQEILFRPDAP